MTLSMPAISVGCKKKELIGNFKNAGTAWLVQKNPARVKVYHVVDKESGKAVPYGVYDMSGFHVEWNYTINRKCKSLVD